MLEEIKQRLDKAQENPLMGQYRIDVGFLLQELEKLQQENERYKEALKSIENSSTHDICGINCAKCIAEDALQNEIT